MRRLRITAPIQLPLALPGTVPTAAQRWSMLSEHARQDVLVLLARLIARGVVVEEDGDE